MQQSEPARLPGSSLLTPHLQSVSISDSSDTLLFTD